MLTLPPSLGIFVARWAGMRKPFDASSDQFVVVSRRRNHVLERLEHDHFYGRAIDDGGRS